MNNGNSVAREKDGEVQSNVNGNGTKSGTLMNFVKSSIPGLGGSDKSGNQELSNGLGAESSSENTVEIPPRRSSLNYAKEAGNANEGAAITSEDVNSEMFEPSSLPASSIASHEDNDPILPRRASLPDSSLMPKMTTNQLSQSKRRSDFFKTDRVSRGINESSAMRKSQLSNSPYIVPKVQVTDLDMIPEIQLPGYKPETVSRNQQREHLKKKESPIDTENSSFGANLFRKLSKKTKKKESYKRSDLESGLTRKKSLVKPERAKSANKKYTQRKVESLQRNSAALAASYYMAGQSKKDHQNISDGPKETPWRVFSRIITFYAPFFVLKRFLKTDNKQVHQAWREKMALFSIIVLLWAISGLVTFGFDYIACGIDQSKNARFPVDQFDPRYVNIRGSLYDVSDFEHPGPPIDFWKVQGRDVSWLFPLFPEQLPDGKSACASVASGSANIACTVDGADVRGYCHSSEEFSQVLRDLKVIGLQSFDWEIITGSDKYMVYNGWVLNLDRYFTQGNNFLGSPDFDRLLVRNVGGDGTVTFTRTEELKQKMDCMVERFRVGVIASTAPDCLASRVLMYVSLSAILIVMVIRFFLAVLFLYTKGRYMGKNPPKPIAKNSGDINLDDSDDSLAPAVRAALESKKEKNANRGSLMFPRSSKYSLQYNFQVRQNENKTPWRASSALSFATQGTKASLGDSSLSVFQEHFQDIPGILRTIMMVTCYSEGEKSLRSTLNSLAMSDYPDTHKMLFIIADGLITGSGNSKSTPDIVKDMIELDKQFSDVPYSYVAVAEGSKRHNMAQVYAGRYKYKDHSVPAILVVKCGTPEEKDNAKPGNRGKRDSQLLLMNFLSKVMFNDRMTPLEFDIFTKMTTVCSSPDFPVLLDHLPHKVTPDLYELVLMVDSDTKVMPDSIKAMSYTMAKDPKVIGLCGETRIANKGESWVTGIQVFEYHLAHFLVKSFESLFGTCTCLPGCFSMYRVKAPKGDVDEYGEQFYVPILANPDIVEAYSENVVDTLHKKNLLLLGEDRYLTTLMLKTFPKRDLVFVPRAVCKTEVPNTFNVLLSQRRRWINSTVHNLLELVLVQNLCGSFCLSLNFVLFMELIGTAILPAAIVFALYLLVLTFFIVPPPIIPFILIAAILGLPAVLVMITSYRWNYLFWLCLYIIALPIWNMILPLYAFWHFDDFSWGQTRKLESDSSKLKVDAEGEFDHTKIIMRHWNQWETDRRQLQQQGENANISAGLEGETGKNI